MKHCIRLSILTLLLTLAHVAGAQDISVDGEYRINPVYSRGFREPMYKGDKAGFYTMQRTRLILNYHKENDLDAEFIMQDRRFWGDQDDRSDVANMSVFRAWVEKYFNPNLSLRLGRQGFVYGNQYLLGEPNWVGTRAHDAALLKYEKEGLQLHLAAAYNANGQSFKREPYEYNYYQNMQFLWGHKEIGKLDASLIFLNRGMERGDTTSTVYYMQTFGTDSELKLSDKVSLVGVYYYQIGRDVQDRHVNAYFYSLQVQYEVNKVLSFNVGVDAGSGNDQTDDEDPTNRKSHYFDRHYGLIHGHFGYLDYFYVNYPTTPGVHDYYVKTKINVTKKLSIEDHVHSFATSAVINDPAHDNKAMSHNLGFENDVLINYKLTSTFKASLGHSIIFGTPTLDQLFGGREIQESQVLYAVITANLNFFKYSKTEKQ
jgi:hypothetical protein